MNRDKKGRFTKQETEDTMKMTFKLTTETTTNAWGVKLYRIEALVDIPARGVKKGEKGGWVESELVSGNARVSGDAWVYDNAWVYGDALVSGDAWVSGKLSLTLGYFFGMRYSKEEIKYVDVEEGSELICKGNIKAEMRTDETETPVKADDTITLNGKLYKLVD